MRDYHKQLDKRMFDFPGFYAGMAERLPNECTIAEVGVANGASAIYLAEALLNLGKEPKFYFIDNLDYGHGDQLRELIRHVCLADLGKWVEIIPLSSVEAATRFPDHHFDFVFIDASHTYEGTKSDIRMWHYKMKDFCYLAGHDYNREEGINVRNAVNEVIPKTRSHPISGAQLPSREIIETNQKLGVWRYKKHPNWHPL